MAYIQQARGQTLIMNDDDDVEDDRAAAVYSVENGLLKDARRSVKRRRLSMERLNTISFTREFIEN